jgi:hypothetical protein
MRELILGSRQWFAELAGRAAGCCIVFPRAEMPPGTLPRVADVGVEVDPENGRAKLCVERGAVYRGSDKEIAKWLQHGQREFPNIDSLRQWLVSIVAKSWRGEQVRCDGCGKSNAPATGRCRHCDAILEPSGMLQEVRQRLAVALASHEATLISGCIGLTRLADEQDVPLVIAQQAIEQLIVQDSSLYVVQYEHELLIYRQAVIQQDRSVGALQRLWYKLKGHREAEVRILELASVRAVLSHRREQLEGNIETLDVREAALRQQFSRAGQSQPRQRCLVRRISQTRGELARLNQLASVMSQQINVANAQIHNLTLADQGLQAPLPDGSDLAGATAHAENALQNLQETSELADSCHANVLAISGEDEIDMLMRELECDTPSSATDDKCEVEAEPSAAAPAPIRLRLLA